MMPVHQKRPAALIAAQFVQHLNCAPSRDAEEVFHASTRLQNRTIEVRNQPPQASGSLFSKTIARLRQLTMVLIRYNRLLWRNNAGSAVLEQSESTDREPPQI